jgi:polar amino acid transport system substrate-binding protein
MRALSLFLLLAFSLLACPVGAQDKPVTLAYVDFPPYEYQEGGAPKGLLVEAVQDIFKRANVSLELVFMPFTRALEEVKTGHVDGVFNCYKTKERLPDLDYTDPIIDNPLVFFTKQDSTWSFDGRLESLAEMRIGAMLGYTYGEGFDRADKFTLDRVTSHEANFHKLALGRIDAYPCDRLVGLYIIQKEKLAGKVQMLPTPLKVMKGHIAFTKGKHEAVIAKLNQVIKDSNKKGDMTVRIERLMKELSE